MTTWNSAFESVPADDDSISAGAGVIRTLKAAIRERMAKDHYMDVSGEDSDHGEHSRITFQAPLESNPATEEDKSFLYTKDVSGKAELFWKDEDGNALQLTSEGALNYTPGDSCVNPAGSVMAFMGTSAPGGWLECNGAAVSRTTYSGLFDVISTMYGAGDGSTTFNLPDIRGYFLRGWDHGAGNDPDASSRTNRGDGSTGDYVGTKQEDDFESHNHSISGASASSSANNGDDERSDGNPTGTAPAIGDAGGSETRPKNINVMYCIKT